MFEIRGRFNTAVCHTDYVEEAAVSQIITLCNQEAFRDAYISIMPDVHAGKGCVIGFTANLGAKVIPNIVGVDIGCGMLTIALGQTEIDFPALDSVIRHTVPSGRSIHQSAQADFPFTSLLCYEQLQNLSRLENSLGTLGGGNHFIEIDEDMDGNRFLVIHTGSRDLGRQVADYYQNLAIEQYAAGEGVPVELSYLTGEGRNAYLHDMRICQQFAQQNRAIIAANILRGMGWTEISRFETVHNYIDNENIIRKGAVAAHADELLLIPINMRDGSLVCVGKGNPAWNYSAPHGAGRVMSRKTAKAQITVEEYQAAMRGIYSTCIGRGTLDESPMAYKNMDDIIRNIGPTATIVNHILPIYNFKASG